MLRQAIRRLRVSPAAGPLRAYGDAAAAAPKRTTGLQAPMRVSPQLSQILGGVTELPRTECTKAMCVRSLCAREKT